MTAIQILEKLGSDASFNPANLTDLDKTEIVNLSDKNDSFNAPLILSHSPAEDDSEDDSDDKPAETE